MSLVNEPVARRVANRVNRDYGETVCTPADVMRAADGLDPLPDKEAIVSRILQELEEYGFRGGER